MKLYLYYLNIHNESFEDFKRIFNIMEYDELPFIDKYLDYQYHDYGLVALYAFTNKKDIDKLFIGNRNKKYFVRETREISKEEYKEYKKKYSDKELEFHKLKNENNKYVSILAPNTEISYVLDGYKDDIIDLFSRIPDLDILNDEYLNILSEFGIIDIQNSFPDFPENISIQELNFYVNTFGILYNKKG